MTPLEPQTKDWFAIKTDVFEGPLEVLIDLVEKRKLLISDISLAEVTDEYLAIVRQRQQQSLPGTAQFVTLAATLLLIKSKSLLPDLELTAEEEGSIEELEERLRQYQLYKDAAAPVAYLFGRHSLFSSLYASPKQVVFAPDKSCNASELSQLLGGALDRLPKAEPVVRAQVVPTVSLDDMIVRLRDRVQKQMKLSFSDLCTGAGEHKNVIVSFLAVLELYKQGDVLVLQQKKFAEIEVSVE